MSQELNGRWTGKLTYGASFGHLAQESLFFTLNLVQKADEFTGTARDEDGIGLSPYLASVKGFVDGEQINFVKEYKLPLVAAQGQSGHSDQDQDPASEASFWGTYNAQTGEFEGEWIILSSYTLLGNVFFERENGGTWRMKRDVGEDTPASLR